MVDAVLLLDANISLLLVVGGADPRFIFSHKRLSSHYDQAGYLRASSLVSEFARVVTIPHVLAEVSSLSRFMEGGGPARREIRTSLRHFIEETDEVMIESRIGAARPEFGAGLGLTDAILLHLAETGFESRECFLFTADLPLYNRALATGCEAFLFDVETGMIS